MQLQHDTKQYLNQIETYRANMDKLQTELDEKKHVKLRFLKLKFYPFFLYLVY
jgi:hypothetical protein